MGYGNYLYFYLFITSLLTYLVQLMYISFTHLQTRFHDNFKSIVALRDERFFSLLYTALFDVEDALASTLILLISLVFIVPMLVLVFTHTKNMITNETTNERNFRVRENRLN